MKSIISLINEEIQDIEEDIEFCEIRLKDPNIFLFKSRVDEFEQRKLKNKIELKTFKRFLIKAERLNEKYIR